MPTSTAYVKVQSNGWKYTFDGVISIAHSLSLKVSTDSDSSVGTDYVNNARNEPDVVTLTVAASNTNMIFEDWAAQTFRSMASIKESRSLCTVATPVWVYEDMLLTDISVVEDETCPDGWTGSLTFTHTDPPTANVKTNDNSSTRSSSGQTGVGWLVSIADSVSAEASLAAFRALLRAAGITGL